MLDERYDKAQSKITESVLPFVALAALFIFLSWRIMSPMVRPLIWSTIFSYFAYPIYKKLYNGFFNEKRPNVAAAITTAIILIFMVLPMIFVLLMLTKESFRIYEAIMSSGILKGSYTVIQEKLYEIPYIGSIIAKYNSISGTPVVEIVINSAINWVTSLLRLISKEIFGNAFRIFYLLVTVGFSSFFFMRDGHLIVSYVTDIIPLKEKESLEIVDRAAKMLHSVVYGVVFTASLQGLLGGLGWWFVGLSNPVFFGFCMFVVGMIPFVGTPVIWVPGAIALFLNNNVWGGVLLVVWGLGVVSTIDNFLRPIYIAEGSKIHMLVIFIGIFGGLSQWGLLGLFIGPLILSIGMFLLDIYRSIVLKKQCKNDRETILE